jgi:hypothetical protein
MIYNPLCSQICPYSWCTVPHYMLNLIATLHLFVLFLSFESNTGVNTSLTLRTVWEISCTPSWIWTACLPLWWIRSQERQLEGHNNHMICFQGSSGVWIYTTCCQPCLASACFWPHHSVTHPLNIYALSTFLHLVCLALNTLNVKWHNSCTPWHFVQQLCFGLHVQCYVVIQQ